MKIGPGGGTMEARDGEFSRSRDLYQIEVRDDGAGEIRYVVRGPFGGKLEAEISGEDKKTLTFTKMLRPQDAQGFDTQLAAFIMLKSMIVRVKEAIEERGQQLGYIKLPMGSYDLQHLFALSGVGEIFGEEAVESGRSFFERRSHDDQESLSTPRRRASDIPEDIVLTLEEITERLKQYEERHGTIRQDI